MNIPKIRFKGFEEAWKEYKLSDIAIITMGQSPNSENYTNDSNDTLLIQGNADLNSGKVIPRLFTKQITKTCDKNDIIMTVRAPVGDIAISDYNACIGRGVCSIKSSKFVYHYLDYLKIKDYWKKISKGSTIDSITKDDIKSLLIKIPNKQEKEKIIKTIDLINKKIELQSKKIEDLKLFKKGLNKYIFRNNCCNYQLKELLIEYNNKTTNNNEYEILSSTADGIVLQSEYFNKQAASQDTTGYKVVPRGYITYRSMSDTGEFHFNEQKIVDFGIVSPAYPVFKINEKIVNKNYILYYMNENKDFSNQILSTKEGGTRFALSFTKLLSLSVKLPNEEEQENFSKILYSIDKKIIFENDKLIKLNELKKGLMQNMFV